MMDDVLDLDVAKPVLVRDKAGGVFRVTPGRQGRGVSVAPVSVKPSRSRAPGRAGNPFLVAPGTTRRGRQPSPVVRALRERLEADGKQGSIGPSYRYADWLEGQGKAVSAAAAIVGRERRWAIEAYPGARVDSSRRPRNGVAVAKKASASSKKRRGLLGRKRA